MDDPATRVPPPDARDGAATPAALDGPSLARMLRSGAAALQRQADALNAINVFPVPDGDTGTNMALTMRAALEGIAGEAPAGEVARAAAHGALMGAKGNSGVILSQILIGAARAVEGQERLDASAIAGALTAARDAAYAVVSNPREGTILTAISAAATAATDAADARNVVDLLQAVARATREAVDRTPELLPVLKEAGVVDAGAEGLYVFLHGCVAALTGEEEAPPQDLGSIDPAWLAATRRLHDGGERHGFCAQFLVTGASASTADVRARMSQLGDGVLVVGDDHAMRVHLHTGDPQAAFDYARSIGVLADERAEDMDTQVGELIAEDGAETAEAPPAAEAPAVAIVAVARGKGLTRILRSMGAAVVPGGQTMNPSVGEIRAAIEATRAPSVIVLPNNRNVVLTARQAADGLAVSVSVIESASIPAGVAALVAFSPDATFEANVRAMRAAMNDVRTAEVTLAARDTRLGSLEVRAGQPIGLVNGDLAVAAGTLDAAVIACVERILATKPGALITLYWGQGTDEASAHNLAAELSSRFGVEVEAIDGGQPHYPYLLSVE